MHSTLIKLKNKLSFGIFMHPFPPRAALLFALLLVSILFLSSCTSTLTGSAVGHPCELQEGLAKDDCYAQELRCSKIRNLQVRESCVAELAMLKNDVAVCDLLTQQTTKGFCLEELAVLNNNHEICRTIENEYWENNCHYNLAVNNSKDVYCSLISSVEQRNDCFLDIALATGNTLLCEHLAASEKEGCIYSIALQTENTETCKELSQPLNQDTCLMRIAKKTGRKELCEAIVFRDVKRECFRQFE